MSIQRYGILKNGGTPWVKAGDIKVPYDLATGKKGKQGKPWTYEEIAKHLHPDMQTPSELAKAIDIIKKQYRAAFELICGKSYDTSEVEAQKNIVKAESSEQDISCDNCTERDDCNDLCPPILE